MANKQINQLTGTSTMVDADLFIVYDIDEGGSEKTKKMTYSDFHTLISGTGGGNPDALYYNTTDVRATATNAGITLGDARTLDIDDDGSGNWTFYNNESEGTIDFKIDHFIAPDKVMISIGYESVGIGEQGSGGIQIAGTGGNGDIKTVAGEIAIRLVSDGAVTLYYDEAIKLDTTNSGIAVTGNISIDNMPSGATQVAAGVTVGDLWRTDTHATLPDGVVMIGI
jgi:hypothetical protein